MIDISMHGHPMHLNSSQLEGLILGLSITVCGAGQGCCPIRPAHLNLNYDYNNEGLMFGRGHGRGYP